MAHTIIKQNTLANLEGAEQAPVPSLGDGLTPSLTVMLAIAKF